MPMMTFRHPLFLARYVTGCAIACAGIIQAAEPAPSPASRARAVKAAPPAERGRNQTPSWLMPPIEGPNLHYRTFDSRAAATRVSYVVYLPPGYDDRLARRYPVVYWLHGIGGSQQGVPLMAQRLTEAIVSGKAPAMIVVYVNGMIRSSYVDSADGTMPVETVTIRELIPHIDEKYRTIGTRDGRMVEGFSMGGAGAAKWGLKYPELFAAISIIDGALHTSEDATGRMAETFKTIYGGDPERFRASNPAVLAERNAAEVRGRTAIRIVTGTTGLAGANERFHTLLGRLGIEHEFHQVPDAPHSPNPLYEGLGDRNWSYYRKAFQAALSAPFRPGEKTAFIGHYGHTEVVLPMEEALANLEQLLTNTPALAGVSLKLWWKTLHPEKNRVRWDALDQMLATCAQHGKRAHLTIFPGMNSPEWIYGEGVRRVGPVTVGGRADDTPVLWDPKYVELFTSLIRELARRHADDPRLESIQITGHNYKGGEMHAPKADSVGLLVEQGLTRAAALQSWRYWIDLFGTLFRRQKLNLVISQMYPTRVNGESFETLPEEVVAYFVQRYQGRAVLQTMQLNGRETASRGQLMSHELCLKYSDVAPNCHEMVGSFKTQPERQGTPEMMIANFIRLRNPLYLQYWRADAADDALIQQVDEAWRTYGHLTEHVLTARLKAEGKWNEASSFERGKRTK